MCRRICIIAELFVIVGTLFIAQQPAASLALPGDEYWSNDFYRLDIYGQVNSLLPHDDVLVLGGDFSAAGGLTVHNIATWDGQQWGTLGTGVSGEITSLLQYNGSLIAAGEFTEAGGASAANITRWDGENWHALGPGSDGRIENLCVFEDQLIALGDFSSHLGPAGKMIATWDGADWTTLGTGPDCEDLRKLLSATVFNELLLVAGDVASFTLVGPMVWDGAEWSAPYPYPGNQPESWIYDYGHISVLGSYQGELIAGGHFFFWDEDTGEHYQAICRWNGSRWIGLDEGLSAPTPIESDDVDVMSLIEYEGNLLAGGLFVEYGAPFPVAMSGVALWDGIAWQPMDVGLFDSQPAGNHHIGYEIGYATDMAIWDGKLILGGSFRSAGAEPRREVYNIAMWESDMWQPLGDWGLGFNGSVMATLEVADQLIVGGSWSNSDGTMAHLARLGDEGWETLGEDPHDWVHAMTLYEDQLVIGGAFSEAGGIPAEHVAAWDGASWQPLGAGVPVVVEALAVYEGALYAGPYRWNGATWTNELQTNGIVRALQVWEENLYAGGSFSLARGIEAAGIAGWNGVECFPLGAGLTHHVSGDPMSAHALTVHDGHLIVGGYFYVAGGLDIQHLARWDGLGWSAFNEWSEVDYHVHSLATHGIQLFVGGEYSFYENPLNWLGRWDGNAWHALGSGIWGFRVRSLLVMNDGLWVGGDFETAGAKPSFNLGYWSDPAVFADPTDVATQIPAATSLLDIYPNPFNPRTTLSFTMLEDGPVQLSVYDGRGRRLRTLMAGFRPAGDYQIDWNGKDQRGLSVATGVYFARLETPAEVAVQKMLIVK